MNMVCFTAVLLIGTIAFVKSSVVSTQFGSMVFYLTNRHPNDYDNYGCWCGSNASTIGNASNNTMDETDLCCKIQAECYENVQTTNQSCTPDGKYHSMYYDDQIKCVDNDGTSNHDLCMCDKQAAECFKRALSTFNSDNKNKSSSTACIPEDIDVCVPSCPAYQACSNGVCVGSGEFGISMTWSRAGDGDIYVTTPSGHSINYVNKGPSEATEHGQLDHDDLVGTGPENIFWNVTAPTGVYHLCFDQYAFSTPASLINPITVTFKIRKPWADTQTLTKTFTSVTRSQNICSPTQTTYVGSVNYP
jgi:hypothetical protein